MDKDISEGNDSLIFVNLSGKAFINFCQLTKGLAYDLKLTLYC